MTCTPNAHHRLTPEHGAAQFEPTVEYGASPTPNVVVEVCVWPPKVAKQCLEQGVAVVGGGIFFAEPPKEACFRLNCARATPEDLARGVGTFCEVLKSVNRRKK